MTSVDDENLSYAYMGPMPYEFIEIEILWQRLHRNVGIVRSK